MCFLGGVGCILHLPSFSNRPIFKTQVIISIHQLYIHRQKKQELLQQGSTYHGAYFLIHNILFFIFYFFVLHVLQVWTARMT